MQFLKRNFIFFIVFVTGAAVLVIEVTATRILAPFFGNTIFTVSSIIGVVLGALSLGYYFGGVLADKYPKFSVFFFLIFIAGSFSLLIQFFSKSFLPILGYNLDIKTGPPIVSLLLFFIPSFFLGMMSPFAIKLETLRLGEVGKVSGKVFFWSTFGSIAGSFLTGFFLIPRWGISKIIISTSLTLMVIGFFGIYFFRKERFGRAKLPLFFIISVLIIGLAFFPEPGEGSVVFQKDGLYSQIKVKDVQIEGKEARVLYLDRALEGGIFLESGQLPFAYTKYYALYHLLNPHAKNILFLGGGAYTTARNILLEQNEVKRVDVAEIEPELHSLAERYFKLPPDRRLFNHIADGRRFLQETDQSYDMIFADVYQSLYAVPVHFTTKEFFTLAKSKLSEKGFFLMNIIGTLKEGANLFLLSEMKTFKEVFQNSYFFAVDSPDKEAVQNFIFLGLKDDSQKIDFKSKQVLEHENKIIAKLPEKLLRTSDLDLGSAMIFTDDFAPVEYLIAKLF